MPNEPWECQADPVGLDKALEGDLQGSAILEGAPVAQRISHIGAEAGLALFLPDTGTRAPATSA